MKDIGLATLTSQIYIELIDMFNRRGLHIPFFCSARFSFIPN